MTTVQEQLILLTVRRLRYRAELLVAVLVGILGERNKSGLEQAMAKETDG